MRAHTIVTVPRMSIRPTIAGPAIRRARVEPGSEEHRQLLGRFTALSWFLPGNAKAKQEAENEFTMLENNLDRQEKMSKEELDELRNRIAAVEKKYAETIAKIDEEYNRKVAKIDGEFDPTSATERLAAPSVSPCFANPCN